jgi:hypothetical protein
MKVLKVYKIQALILGLVVFSSCVGDGNFSIPDTTIIEPVLDGQEISINAVAGNLSQAQGNNRLDYSNDETLYTFPTDSPNQYISGYVISSDEAGNYFEELIVQDSPENPSIGLKILIDANPLFVRYEIGRKVFVKLNGLVAGISNGVLSIGQQNGTRVDKIAASLENEFILRSTDIETITPLLLDISEFTDSKTNLFIELQNVQFGTTEVLGNRPFTYASEPFDQFNAERRLVSCNSGEATLVATSTFSDFKGLSLPINKGSMKAVLSKNFFGDTFNVTINTPEDVNFDTTDRCGCGLTNTVGTNSLFEDDFESQSNNNLISGNGWTNVIEEGTEGWEAYTSAGSNASLGRSARVSSANSNDQSTVAWLVTPAINLDVQTGETLSFVTSNSFADASTMTVLFSKNWDGSSQNISSATWKGLVDATVVSDGTFFGDWISSGAISLDCKSGSIHIAFVYKGNDIGSESSSGTYELDEIKISSN